MTHSDPQSEQRASVPDVDDILADQTLTRAQKVERLRRLAFDEKQLSIASNEGMEGRTSRIGRIHEALRSLDADAHRA